MIIPTTKSSFTSTIWNSPAKASRSISGSKFGGPNINISVGSKVQFGDGNLIWDVARIYEDGTLHLTAVSSGRRITRKVPPSSASWTNLWMVDGKSVRKENTGGQSQLLKGGGPNRNFGPGNVLHIGNSRIRWTVISVYRDGTVKLQAMSGDKVVTTNVGPKSKFWNSMYSVNG